MYENYNCISVDDAKSDLCNINDLYISSNINLINEIFDKDKICVRYCLKDSDTFKHNNNLLKKKLRSDNMLYQI